MITVSMTIFYNHDVSAVYDQTDMLSEAYSSSVGTVVSRAYLEIDRASKDKEIGENFIKMEPKDLENYLIGSERARTKEFMFYSLSLIDKDGVTYDGYDISSREYVQKALAGTPNISSPVLSKKDNIMTYYIAKKLDNGVSDGLAFAGLDISYFYDIIKGYEESNDYGGLAFMIDKTGTYIVSSDMSKVENAVNPILLAEEDSTYKDSARLFTEMIKGEAGKDKVTLENGEKYYVSYKPIDSNDGWSIAVLIPEDKVISPFLNTLLIMIVISIVALVLATLSFTFSSKRFAKPIGDVVGRIKELESGDLTDSVNISDYTTETNTLSVSLLNTINTLSEHIAEVSETLEQISNGNLNIEILRDYDGDFAPLKNSLNGILKSLNEIMLDINRSSSSVSSGSSHVADAALALSEGVTEQKTAVDKLSVSIDKITQKVNKNAENAKIASDNSANQSVLIENGNIQMKQMTQAMSDINSTSSQIANIIKTIDDIAFQTNILSLNAAVEAARAGSSGKGFAVVADEVRNLAAKSAEAAKVTTSLIQSSISAIENGAKIAEETAQTLEKIVENSAKTTELIKEISVASEEQVDSLNEVISGVEKITDVVQSNASASEEIAASAEELSSEAQMLDTLVGKFKTKSGK